MQQPQQCIVPPLLAVSAVDAVPSPLIVTECTSHLQTDQPRHESTEIASTMIRLRVHVPMREDESGFDPRGEIPHKACYSDLEEAPLPHILDRRGSES